MSVGIWQLVLIIMLVLILFGAGKLPQVMGEIGAGLKKFKDGMNGNLDSQKQNNDSPKDLN